MIGLFGLEGLLALGLLAKDSEAVDEMLGTIFAEDVEAILRSHANEFRLSREHEKEMMKELTDFVSKWSDLEKYPADPSRRGEKAKMLAEMDDPNKNAEKSFALIARFASCAYFAGVTISSGAILPSPKPVRPALQHLLAMQFLKGAKTVSDKVDDFLKEKEAQRGHEQREGEHGDGGSSADAAGAQGGSGEEGQGAGHSDQGS